MPSRNKRERERIAAKRADPAYRQAENQRQQTRMRERRRRKDYQKIERDNRWWK